MNICYHCYPEFPLGVCQAERCNTPRRKRKGFVLAPRKNTGIFHKAAKLEEFTTGFLGIHEGAGWRKLSIELGQGQQSPSFS